MAGVSLNSPRFGNATTVSIYNLTMVEAQLHQGRAPQGVTVTTGTLNTAGTIGIAGLTAPQPYAAYFTSGAASTPTYVVFHGNA